MGYDYICAPWLVEDRLVKDFSFPLSLLNRKVVGNGGFSLTSQRLLEMTPWFAKKSMFTKRNLEDISICVWQRSLFEKQGLKLAPYEIAKDFNIEGETISTLINLDFIALYGHI